MDINRIIEIFEIEDSEKWEGDNAYQGLQIISKYTKNIISGASLDIIFSEDIDTLICAGITEEDCIKLRRLNWMISNNSLACFI